MPSLKIGIQNQGAVQGANQIVEALGRINQAARTMATGLQGNTAQATSAIQAAAAATRGQLQSLELTASTTKTALVSLFGTLTTAFTVRALVKAISDFDLQIKSIAAATGATAEEIAYFTSKAREMGATTQFSATQAAEGMLILARSGLNTVQATKVLPDVLNLAAAAQLSLHEASSITTNTLHQFNLAVTDTTRITDILVNTANKTNTDVALLGESLKYVGNTAQAAGLSLEETVAALGVLADSGLRGSLAGTTLRQVLTSLLSPTGLAAEQLKEMNLSLKDMNPAANSLEAVMSKLTGQQLTASAAVELFTRRSAGAALALTQMHEHFSQLAEDNKNVAGTAARNAEVIGGSLPKSFDKLKASVQEAFIQVGDEGFKGALQSAIDTASGAVRVLSGTAYGMDNVSESSKRLASALEGLIGGFATVTALQIALKGVAYVQTILATAAAIQVQAAADVEETAMGRLRAAVATENAAAALANARATTGATTATLALAAANYNAAVAMEAASVAAAAESVATAEATTATAALTAAMDINPIFLIISAIGALVAAFIYFKDTMLGTGETSATVMDYIVTGWTRAADGLGAVWEMVVDLWHISWDFIKGITATAWAWIRTNSSAAWKWFVDTAKSALDWYLNAWKTTFNWVIGASVAYVKTIIDIFQPLIDMFKAYGKLDFSSPTAFFKSFSEVGLAQIDVVKNFSFEKIWNNIKGDWKDSINHDWAKDVGGYLSEAWNGSLLQGWANDVKGMGKDFGGYFIDGAKFLMEEGGDLLGDYLHYAKLGLGEVGDLFSDWQKEAAARARAREAAQRAAAHPGMPTPSTPGFTPSAGGGPSGGDPITNEMLRARARWREMQESMTEELRLEADLRSVREVNNKMLEAEKVIRKAKLNDGQAQLAQYRAELQLLQELKAAREIYNAAKQVELDLRLTDYNSLQLDYMKDYLSLEQKIKDTLGTDTIPPALQARLNAYKQERIYLADMQLLRNEANEMGSAVGDAFNEFITGSKNAMQAVEQLAKAIEQAFLKAQVVNPIANFFSNVANSGLRSLFGGAAPTSTSANTPSATFTPGNVTPGPQIDFNPAISFTPNWAGNAFSGPIHPFARGDVFGNKQYFPMANGAVGSVAEGGRDEGLFPLRRNARGELAVQGSGGKPNVTVNAHFHGVTDMNSYRSSKNQIMSDLSRSINSALYRRG